MANQRNESNSEDVITIVREWEVPEGYNVKVDTDLSKIGNVPGDLAKISKEKIAEIATARAKLYSQSI